MKKYTSVLLAIFVFLFITARTAAASPFVFIASEGDGEDVPGIVSIINVTNNYAITQFSSAVAAGGQTIAITPDQTKAVIANRLNDTIYSINTATSQVTTISAENDGKIVITPNGQKAYVSNHSGDIVIINLTNNSVTGTVDNGEISGGFPFFLAISPDGTKLYASDVVCCGESGTTKSVAVINTATDTVSATIPLAGFLQDIIVSSDNSKIYVANIGTSCCPVPSTGTVAVINAATNEVTNTISVGMTPVGLALTPDGNKLYVANHESDNVSVINTATNLVTSTISLGANASPTTIAITPDGTKAFVLKSFFTDDGHTEVAVIDTASDTIITTLTLPNALNSFFINLFDRGFTETGSNVVITPTSNVTMTFSSTATSGDTSVITSAAPPAVPDGFKIKNGNLYFTITTTAVFSGTVQICINYTGDAGENSLKFLHEEGGVWVDRTTSLNTANNILCGSVTSFSEFAVVLPPTIEDLIGEVGGMDLPPGIQNSLIVKLKSAQKSLDPINKLQAFINEVEAQNSKGLTEAQAEKLKNFATNIIKILQGAIEF